MGSFSFQYPTTVYLLPPYTLPNNIPKVHTRGLKCSYIQILVVGEILICFLNLTSCAVLKIQTQTLVACMAALSVGAVTVTP